MNIVNGLEIIRLILPIIASDKYVIEVFCWYERDWIDWLCRQTVAWDRSKPI